MTENNLQNLQIAAKAAAQDLALRLLKDALSAEPGHREILRRCAAELDRRRIERTIPGADPNEAMLIDGETQQALKTLAIFLVQDIPDSTGYITSSLER